MKKSTSKRNENPPAEPHQGAPHHDAELKDALHDVCIPSGLEQQLLMAIEEIVVMPSASQHCQHDRTRDSRGSLASGHRHHDNTPRSRQPSRLSRRKWLYATGAALGGTAAIFGHYSRSLTESELSVSIQAALAANSWVLPWEPMNQAPANVLPLPSQLRRPRGWQCIETTVDSKSVAFDVTQPLRPPAVLFGIRVWRDISHFPDTMPKNPANGRSATWQLAMWRNDKASGLGAKVLFVLAWQGTVRDYRRLRLGTSASRLA